MTITNKEIAHAFYRFADLLEIEGNNPYRIRAYRKAAGKIQELSRELSDLVNEGSNLTEIKYIGKGIASHIQEIIKTEDFTSLTNPPRKKPSVLSDLREIEGIGAKRLSILNNELKIFSRSDLLHAIKKDLLKHHSAFGEKIQKKIKHALLHPKYNAKQIRLFQAVPSIESILAKLRKYKEIIYVMACNEYRRKKEVVGDVDIIVVSKESDHTLNEFIHFYEVKEIVSLNPLTACVKLHIGIRVTIRCVPAKHYGTAIFHYTGSSNHVEQMMILLNKQGYSLHDNRIRQGKKYIPCKDEIKIYQLANCEYIHPELRENRGEIAAAQSHTLPNLISIKDIKGDLHCHTNETDGSVSLETMVIGAKEKGYHYVAITDHSQRLAITNGMNVKRLLQQIKLIDKLNEKLIGITILKSIEVDIMEDGTLDLPNSILKELDLTVCSIHYKFRIPEKNQTERILRAMDNPYFTILGHATGRLINRRQPYLLNLERIFQAAKERNCFIELNAQPYRLDINDIYCQQAKSQGVKFAISTDAHSVREFDFMKFGVYQARRGWLETNDVINTRNLADLRQLMRRK